MSEYWQTGKTTKPLTEMDILEAIKEVCGSGKERPACLHGNASYWSHLERRGMARKLGICLGCGWPIPTPQEEPEAL